MAEGFARKYGSTAISVSAGLRPGRTNPEAVKAMAAAGVDISVRRAQTLDEIKDMEFDLVVTLGEEARHGCPMLPGAPAVMHWDIDGDERADGRGRCEQEYERRARDIGERVRALFAFGFLQSLVMQRRNFQNIMSSLPAGVIVHDLNRRIVYLSPRAESILGYAQKEVLGQDCHSVIQPNLCGGECSLSDCCGSGAAIVPRRYTTSFLTKDGARRELDMSVVPLFDESGAVAGVLASFTDQTELRRLERAVERTFSFAGIIGQDHKMQLIYDLVTDLAQSDFPVLITGESGTGKELVARAIHNESRRRDKQFVPINCGAIPEGTLESELFGHVRGAFTGAIRDKKGRFELADGGTIFLDEVAELSPAMQVKLLRVLQEGTFEPVGSETSRTCDVRVISATNKKLKERVKSGAFREDLYYRLAVVPVDMPPLRDRRNDIPLLAGHFLREISARIGRKDMAISKEALSLMMSYAWPGNVRQLQNAIQFSLIKCHGAVIEPHHLPPELTGGFTRPVGAQPGEAVPGKAGRKPKLALKDVEFALRKVAGNKARAARMLRVGRATLYNFLKEHPQLETIGEEG